MTAFEELTRVMGRMGQTLDDRSAELVARLREKGVLDDKDWGRIHEWLAEALEFLAGPDHTVSRDKQGQSVLNLDADPRNADWLRIVGAYRRSGYRLPMWAAMWLWRLGHDRKATFWQKIGSTAKQLGFPKQEKTKDK